MTQSLGQFTFPLAGENAPALGGVAPGMAVSPPEVTRREKRRFHSQTLAPQNSAWAHSESLGGRTTSSATESAT